MGKFKFKTVKRGKVQRPRGQKGTMLLAGVCAGSCRVFGLWMSGNEPELESCPRRSKHYVLAVNWCRDCGAWLIDFGKNTPRRCKEKGLGHHTPSPIFEAPAGTTNRKKFKRPEELGPPFGNGHSVIKSPIRFMPAPPLPKGAGN